MKILLYGFFCALCLGCVRSPLETLNVTTYQDKKIQNTKSNKLPENPCRLTYLIFSINNIEAMVENNHVELESYHDLYGLVKSIQDSSITVQDIHKKSFYFDDAVGQDVDGYSNDRFFTCMQVFTNYKDENSSQISSYEALYTNPNLNITVTVDWYGVQPLVGQKLNTDFLIFIEARQYETVKNTTRAELVFLWPRWAVRNGYYDTTWCTFSKD